MTVYYVRSTANPVAVGGPNLGIKARLPVRQLSTVLCSGGTIFDVATDSDKFSGGEFT